MELADVHWRLLESGCFRKRRLFSFAPLALILIEFVGTRQPSHLNLKAFKQLCRPDFGCPKLLLVSVGKILSLVLTGT